MVSDGAAPAPAPARAKSAESAVAEGLHARLQQDGPIPLDVSLDCGPGEVLGLFGPSGSGKTTILRSIAGLYRPQLGVVRCHGALWLDTARGVCLPPHRRQVGLVFQEYALFPHRDAVGNVVAALGHRPSRERVPRARELLALVKLSALAHRYPGQLSGGQRQRLAIPRALAREPSVLLMDEPFAALDAPLRRTLLGELEALRTAIRLPIVLVTHDFDEVARLADRLVLLDAGRQVAAGTVSEVSARPDLPMLSGVDDPASLLEAVVEAHVPERRMTKLAFAGGTLWARTMPVGVGVRIRVRISAREVALARRVPEDISLHNILRATVTALTPASDPALVYVTLRTGAATLVAAITHDAVVKLGVEVGDSLYALIKSLAILQPGELPLRR